MNDFISSICGYNVAGLNTLETIYFITSLKWGSSSEINLPITDDIYKELSLKDAPLLYVPISRSKSCDK